MSQIDKNGDLSKQRKFTTSSADATTEHFLRVPSFFKSALCRVQNQLPKLDPMDLFPIGVEGVQGVIVLGTGPYCIISFVNSSVQKERTFMSKCVSVAFCSSES